MRAPELSRRQFLAGLAAGAVGVGVVGVGAAAAGVNSWPTAYSQPASFRDITIGFLPICCATGILTAHVTGEFEKAGLRVRLRKFAGWADLWSAFVAGDIQAAHMLAPMPFAIAGRPAAGGTDLTVPLIANTGGQALVVRPDLAEGFAPARLRGCVIGIPFDYSMHNLILRDVLAGAGLDPGRDVELRLLRPADMVAGLLTGQVDGFIGPEPFITRAVTSGYGAIAINTLDYFPNHPCCAFAVRADFAAAVPEVYRQLVAATRAGICSAQPADARASIAQAISGEAYLNQPVSAVTAALTRPNYLQFDPTPHAEPLEWMATQLGRWGLVDSIPSSPVGVSTLVGSIYTLAPQS